MQDALSRSRDELAFIVMLHWPQRDGWTRGCRSDHLLGNNGQPAIRIQRALKGLDRLRRRSRGRCAMVGSQGRRRATAAAAFPEGPYQEGKEARLRSERRSRDIDCVADVVEKATGAMRVSQSSIKYSPATKFRRPPNARRSRAIAGTFEICKNTSQRPQGRMIPCHGQFSHARN
jgi:hypothetical protein